MKRAALLLPWLALACAAESEDDVDVVLSFDTEPICPAADATCVNAGTETLDVGGWPVIYKRIPGHPLVAIRVAFDSRLDRSRQAWAEGFALDLLERRGSRRFSSSSWNAELLRLESGVGAGLGLDYGSIAAVAPRFNWREVWGLLVESMTDVGSSADYLENLQGIATQSLLGERDDPDDAARSDAWSRAFYRQPYNYRREHRDALAEVADADIGDAWATLGTSERMLVAVAGDVERDEVITSVRALRDALLARARSVTFPADDALPSVEQPAIQVLPYPDAPTWYITSYFHGPAADSPDYARLALGLDVLARRLFREIRDVRGLAYTTGAGISFYRESVGSLSITSNAPLEAIPIARQIITDLERDGPTEDELAAARASRVTSLLAGSDTPTGLASTLVDWQLTAGRREALDDYLLALQQATPGEVASAVTTYLRDARTAAAGGGSALTVADLEGLFPAP